MRLHAQRRDGDKRGSEFISRHGIIVVEGFNDVVGLDNPGIPSVGLMSNRMTEEQAQKVALWARQLADRKVALLLDCDQLGDDGRKGPYGYWLRRG